MSNSQVIAYYICAIISFIPAIVFHEIAHGYAAYKMGDPTAKQAGRLSVNPLRHIDPFGTVILPLLLMVLNAPIFGYAKPVPYNPAYFKDKRKGDLIVGFAGPAANLAMTVIAALICWALLPVANTLASSSIIFAYFYYMFLPLFAFTNMCLLFFNILPIPPLDGSSIYIYLIPKNKIHVYYQIERYAMPIFMLLLLVIPYILPINPIGAYMNFFAGNLTRLMFPPAIASPI